MFFLPLLFWYLHKISPLSEFKVPSAILTVCMSCTEDLRDVLILHQRNCAPLGHHPRFSLLPGFVNYHSLWVTTSLSSLASWRNFDPVIRVLLCLAHFIFHTISYKVLILKQMAGFPSTLRINNIPSYVHTARPLDMEHVSVSVSLLL